MDDINTAHHISDDTKFNQNIVLDNTFEQNYINSALSEYINSPVFKFNSNHVVTNSVYSRPIYQPIDRLDLKTTINTVHDRPQDYLFANRILYNIYEQDLIFLPTEKNLFSKNEMNQFYNSQTYMTGQYLKPRLEEFIFNHLDTEISITGTWTLDMMHDYLIEKMRDIESSTTNDVINTIMQTNNPKNAFLNTIIQNAADLISEASGTMRNVLGSYGKIQSELFILLIDEFGYGIHDEKHSTLFEQLLLNHGLQNHTHAYWHYYLRSSLLLHNYSHFLSQNHANFFRRMGSLYYEETSYAHSCKQMSRMLKKLYGESAKTIYYDEHVHIDKHHKILMLERILIPLVQQCGNDIIKDIIRGVEEFEYIISASSKDLIDQLIFIDNLSKHKQQSQEILKTNNYNFTHKIELSHDEFITNASNTHQILKVEHGSVKLSAGYSSEININTQETAYIPQGRHYLLINNSDYSSVNIYQKIN